MAENMADNPRKPTAVGTPSTPASSTQDGGTQPTPTQPQTTPPGSSATPQPGNQQQGTEPRAGSYEGPAGVPDPAWLAATSGATGVAGTPGQVSVRDAEQSSGVKTTEQ